MNPFQEIYEKEHGRHFGKELYEYAVAGMENEDGTKGPHWSVEEAANYAKAKGLSLTRFNEYDLAYAMNMVYSDYKGAIPDNTESYFRVARAFLEDKDAPEGKAYLYWKAMRC